MQECTRGSSGVGHGGSWVGGIHTRRVWGKGNAPMENAVSYSVPSPNPRLGHIAGQASSCAVPSLNFHGAPQIFHQLRVIPIGCGCGDLCWGLTGISIIPRNTEASQFWCAPQ